MGPITYSLCQKPIIGVVMWITTLCSFPPLFVDVPISLSVAGSTASTSFSVPVDKGYPLEITFDFPSLQARLNDQIVGARYDENCDGTVQYEQIPETKRAGLGRPIPFKVTIRSTENHVVVQEEVFDSLCVTSHIDSRKNRTIGWLKLKRGQYTIEVTNVQAQSGLDNVKTQISLYAGLEK